MKVALFIVLEVEERPYIDTYKWPHIHGAYMSREAAAIKINRLQRSNPVVEEGTFKKVHYAIISKKIDPCYFLMSALKLLGISRGSDE